MMNYKNMSRVHFIKFIFWVKPNYDKIQVTLAYHTVLMGVKQGDFKSHEAINTIKMAVKKRVCYRGRLTPPKKLAPSSKLV